MAPATIDPTILNNPIRAIDKAPKEEAELQTKLIKLPWIIGLLDSAINAGKCAVIKASWKPQEKKPKNSIMYVGSFVALIKTELNFSFTTSFDFFGLTLNNGKNNIEAIIIREKIIKVDDQEKFISNALAIGGPITCPADPAAVAIPSTNDLLSGDEALPTTDKIKPNPVPAIPAPIKIFNNWCPKGEEVKLLTAKPIE